MITNVMCANRGGLIYPTKQPGKERTHKIDGAIALIMAISRAMVADDGDDLGEFFANVVA